jgi:hypothetical protein
MSGTLPGLGRLFHPDPRDWPLRAVAAPAQEPVERRTKIWTMRYRWLDQGATGTCVGHGWKHELLCEPTRSTKRLGSPTPFDIYDAAISIDEWTENDGDTARQFGTSVRAGAKVLQALGLLDHYAFVQSIHEAIDWLCSPRGGPLVTGFNWYETMFERNAAGFLTIGGAIRGGHCTLAHGWDNRRGAVKCLTSWRDFGPFWLAGEDFERLLREDGEACAPVDRAQLVVTP